MNKYTPKDLNDQYLKIDEATSKIAALELALDNAKQSGGIILADTVTPLKSELQAVLVNAALGADVEAEISQLEKAIASATLADSKANKAALAVEQRLADTVQGIEAKLAEERAALDELTRDATVMKRSLLADQARVLALEYSERAQAALLSLKKLMALDRIVAANDSGRASGQLPGGLFTLSMPRVPGMPELPYQEGQHFIDKESWQIGIDAELELIKNELVDSGFRL